MAHQRLRSAVSKGLGKDVSSTDVSCEDVASAAEAVLRRLDTEGLCFGDELLPREKLVVREKLVAREKLRLRDVTLLKDETRSVVARGRVEAAQGGSVPQSVVIKYIRDDPARGFTDWASLAFLSETPEARGLVPRFLGGDVDRRVFVMEDLGSLTRLEDVFNGNDPAAVLDALRRMGVTMGRLCAAGWGREAAFTSLRSRLPAAEGLDRRYEAKRWRAGMERALKWFEAVPGLGIPAALETCLDGIAKTYADPEAFLTFSHGDPAPTNALVGPDGVRLVDFEYGGFRHALYDLAAWNVLCPLPAEWVRALVESFRETLAPACSAVGDETLYRRGWAALSACRTMAILTWIGPDVIGEDRPWVGPEWTCRQAVLAALKRAAEAAAGVPELASFREAADRLQAALRSRWPEFEGVDDVTPRWRAAGGGDPPPGRARDGYGVGSEM